MEEGTKLSRWPIKTGKGKDTDSPLEPPEGRQTCQGFHFSLQKLISDFSAPELWGNTFVLFSAWEFVITCYSSNRKLVHSPCRPIYTDAPPQEDVTFRYVVSSRLPFFLLLLFFHSVLGPKNNSLVVLCCGHIQGTYMFSWNSWLWVENLADQAKLWGVPTLVDT